MRFDNTWSTDSEIYYFESVDGRRRTVRRTDSHSEYRQRPADSLVTVFAYQCLDNAKVY